MSRMKDRMIDRMNSDLRFPCPDCGGVTCPVKDIAPVGISGSMRKCTACGLVYKTL